MKIYENGVIREMTDDELAAVKAEKEAAEREYWTSVDYGEAVDNEIRKKYSVSAEFAILRQKGEKQEEFLAYYDYCEECKVRVREEMIKYAKTEI
jgi:hypothetical protein